MVHERRFDQDARAREHQSRCVTVAGHSHRARSAVMAYWRSLGQLHAERPEQEFCAPALVGGPYWWRGCSGRLVPRRVRVGVPAASDSGRGEAGQSRIDVRLAGAAAAAQSGSERFGAVRSAATASTGLRRHAGAVLAAPATHPAGGPAVGAARRMREPVAVRGPLAHGDALLHMLMHDWRDQRRRHH
jgi:hypothetical protein